MLRLYLLIMERLQKWKLRSLKKKKLNLLKRSKVVQEKLLFVFEEEIKLNKYYDETAVNLREQQRNFKWLYL